MKVTKSQENRKVVAFYAKGELVFRDRDSNQNYVFNDSNSIYKGGYEFDYYLETLQKEASFIAFYKGDTIIIEL